MTSRGVWGRRIGRAIGLLLLLGLAWTGVSGGVQQLAQPRSLGQTVQTIAQLGYGLSALLAVGTAFRRTWWDRWVQSGFAVTTTLAGGLAPVVWGERAAMAGLLAGGAAFLVALAAIALVRVPAR